MSNKRQGLNLIELTVAIAMIAIILVTVINTFSAGARHLRKIRMESTGYFLAQEAMESLNQTLVFGASPDRVKSPVTGFPDYNLSVDVYNDPLGAAMPELRGINVTVFWRGQAGEKSWSLYSIISNMTE